jgi:lysophospholipase L1-like esterase
MQSFDVTYPKVFVIGDSISMHYDPYLEKSLSGFFKYDRKRGTDKNLDEPNGANGGDSNMVLAYLKELENSDDFKTDYLLINCGLHDIKRSGENSDCQVSVAQYVKNLEDIITLSRKLKMQLIWINSTPVVDTIHNAKMGFKRYNNDIIKYNNAAADLMKKERIPIIDLYTFTKKFIPEGYIDHVHYNLEVRQQQADFIAGSLTAIYKSNLDD